MTIDELKDYKPGDSSKQEANKEKQVPETHIKTAVSKGRRRDDDKHVPWFLSILLPDETWSISDLIEYRIIPSIRSGIHGLIIEIIDGWFDDDTDKKRHASSGSYISYSRYSDTDRNRSRNKTSRYNDEESRSRRSKAEPAFCEIEFDTRKDAQDALDSLDDAMAEYHILNMADAYATANLTPVYTDFNYGWKDISKAYIRREGRKFILVMPKAQPIGQE